jgi:PAS domain S-box-containing protein
MPSEFIATFSRQRQQLLSKTAQVLPINPDASSSSPEAVPLTQCLVTSLEELKVAEEEMMSQQMEIMTLQAESDRKITYWRTLFDLAPTPLMLTTQDGTIRAANQALATLLTRDVYHLEGKPMVALVPNDLRPEFRSQLKRVVDVGGVEAWTLVLERKTREPVSISATIQLIPSALTGTMALYWSIRETR